MSGGMLSEDLFILIGMMMFTAALNPAIEDGWAYRIVGLIFAGAGVFIKVCG